MMKKTIIKIFTYTLLALLVSVIAINIISPAIQKNISPTYKEQLSQMLFETDSIGTEKILCIDDNEAALLWRLRMIANAKESIVLTTFDMRDDESGTAIMAALLDAANRDIKIKILIDGIYQLAFLQNSDTFNALCAHENIEARYYNPVNPGNIYRVNYRMHDKYLIVDEQMYLLGGRNVSDTFLGTPQKGANIDRDILVYHTGDGTGESLQQLQAYFFKIWAEPCLTPIEGLSDSSTIEQEYSMLSDRYTELKMRYEDFSLYNKWQEDTFNANKITLISNGTHAGSKEPQVLYTIEQLALNGKEVIIQTPYVICNQAMYDTLTRMEANAEVSIFLNAVARGSNPWGCTDYLNNKSKILATGATVYEVMNEYAVHTKAVLIDDNISIIGSYNLDMRSTYLDTELMLVIDSEYLNAHIRTMTEEYKAKSIEVLPDGTESKGALYYENELSSQKKALYDILRIIIQPFRHML